MQRVLTGRGGERAFLLGNEAIARGALEAGVAVAATYPGTPATEIGDTLFRIGEHTDRFYFEYSTNEKVALEMAAGAAIAGVRSLCAMKHVGLNVASDPLMTLAYLGINGGMVVVTADEPGCHSSQNEQDNRIYARLAGLPLLEPATPQEAKDFTRDAFALSERLGLPVLLRSTTRVSHMRGVVVMGELPELVVRQTTFQRDPGRFAYNPGVAKQRRRVLLDQLAEAERLAGEDRDRNPVVGDGPLGVLVSGVGYNYVRDALVTLDLADRVRVGKLGFSHPISRSWMLELLSGMERCLVVEEVEPLLEQEAKAVAHEEGLAVIVHGRTTGDFTRHGEMSLQAVTRALAALTGRPASLPEVGVRGATGEKEGEVGEGEAAQGEALALPGRPPSLCPGCPHRDTFYAAKVATRHRAHYHLDIGCYTLGQLPPLSLCDLLICMGAGITTGAAFARVTDRPSIAFIGDSTFFHSGIPGLINAVHNRHRMVVVVMDNRTTAMTGHQPHPGTALDGMHGEAPALSIEALCRAAGAGFVETVDPTGLRRTVEVFQRAMDHPGVAVIVSRAACVFVDGSLGDRPAYRVDPDRCSYCGLYGDTTGCGERLHHDTQVVRGLRRIETIGAHAEPGSRVLVMPDKPAVAPCTRDCPAHVCVQSYASLVAAGRYREAARAVRERIPLPGTVSRVCHRPCEADCTRIADGGAVAINALKRFAVDREDPEEVRSELRERLSAAPRREERVAVIGSGPAGLAAAHDLRLRGYPVTVYESAPVPGGMLALGIPAYRLDRDLLRSEIDLILSLGIDLHLGTRVGVDVSFDALRERHAAVVVAAGAWRPVRLGVPGEERPGVIQALDLLGRVNLGEPVALGRRVVVVGGGDAAVDAARVARRLTLGEITLVYRRTREEMPAHPEAIAAAEAEGITLSLQNMPVAVLGSDGERPETAQPGAPDASGGDVVCALRLARTEPGEADPTGRRRPVVVPGSEHDLACDTLIVAVGQQPDVPFLSEAAPAGSTWTVPVDPADGAITLPGVFVAGDLAGGPRTVIHAIASGQRAAFGVDRFLAGGRWEAVRPVAPPARPATPSPEGYLPVDVPPAPREPQPELEAGSRVSGFQEVEGTLSEEAARREAERCLLCGQCAKCRVCVDTFGCPAILVSGGRIHIDELLCVGCGVCAQLCPNNAIQPVAPAT